MNDWVLRRLSRAGSDLPPAAKRAAQWLLSVIDPVLVRRYRRKTGYRDPIPPIALRSRAGSPKITSFLGGAAYQRRFEEALRPAGLSLRDFERVLDFGCGSGRVLVPLSRSSEAEAAFHGCDIDEDAIAWLRRSYPELTVAVNSFHPPLPYDSNSFDLVYSVSVFTHLDEQGQSEWLKEIRRVVRPSGVVLATVHGEHAFQQFASGQAVGAIRSAPERIRAHSLADRGFAYEPAEPSRWNALQFIDSGGWGLAFQSERYVNEQWGRVFPTVDVLSSQGTQDLVRLRA